MVPYIQYFHNTYNSHVQAAGSAHPWPRPQRPGGIKSRSPETGLSETKRRLRTILCQDLVTTSSSPWIRKDRCLFLFNDILLITTVSRRGAKVLAKLYFVEKFLGMNKHIHRRSREAFRRCRAVCRRCWRCVGTSLWICCFLSDDILFFEIVECAFVLFYRMTFLHSGCGCTSPSPMSTSARPKRRV